MRTPNSGLRACLVLLSLTLFATSFVNATTFKKQASIVDLLKHSELIVHARVLNVSDGIDSNGIPYTEVKLQVFESIKGQVNREFTFRQFGLLKPRKMDNGLTNLMVTPASWASFKQGEEAILFLHKQAAWTGLRTTAGLGQGKFNVQMAGAVNQVNNSGLFQNVYVDPTVLDTNDKRVMSTTKGPVNARSFVALVKRAVNGQWVEKGQMRNEK